MSGMRHSHSAAAAYGCLEVQDCTCPVSQIRMYSTSAEARCLLQEALRTQKEPSTVLYSRIWKMAGQVLMDNPDCPVEVSRAVHALMGISLPEVPVGSPVSQANSRQARTAQALQGVSLAAQESLAGMTASGQQLQQPTAYDEQAEAHRMQQEATQLLSTALATISSQCQSPLLQAGGADHQVVGAVMAPIVLQSQTEQYAKPMHG